MIYGDVADYLATIIDYKELDKPFDFDAFKNNSNESYINELHKFNYFYKCYFFNNNRLVFMINNYEIVLKKDVLTHLIEMYLYFKEKDNRNSMLIAEFLLSYYNTIKSKEYNDKVSNAKNIIKQFNEVILKSKELKNPVLEFSNVSYKLYDMVIDHSIKQKNFYVGEMVQRACTNLKLIPDMKNKLIEKFLRNQILPMNVIEFDSRISEHVSYYEQYIKYIISENTYYKYPENIIYKLDNIGKLRKNIKNLILNNIIDKINAIHDRAFNYQESVIQLIAEIDEIIQLINRLLNKLKSLNERQRKKIHECINNILYIKRVVLSDDDRIKSQMQEFTYNTSIPNKEISEYVELVETKPGILYHHSCGNFIKKLEDSLNIYSEHAISYTFNSFNIDSEKQIYFKSDDIIENTVFKQYYDSKGMEYTKQHPELQNKLDGGYYSQMLKCIKNQFVTEQFLIISFFNINKGEGSLIKLLMSRGELVLKNKYVVLAINVSQIEHMIVELLKKHEKKHSKSGVSNLNELAKDYIDDPTYFNGLMYINYILYERQGLDIRNNIAHGNYFKKDIEVELLTTFCAIMFLNSLYRKECDTNYED